jgi:O-antigen/teichoic acid export membrane protein
MTAAPDVAVRTPRSEAWARRRSRGSVVRRGAIVFASTLAWHASNFLFNGVTARLLGPARYGDLAATLALLYVVSPLLVSVQTVTSAAATELAVRGRAEQIRSLLRAQRIRVGIAAIAVAGLMAAASPLVARFLRLDSPLPLVVVGIGLGLSITTHWQRGVLQGTNAFGRYAASTLVEASTKIAAAVVTVVFISSTTTGAAAAVPISAMFGLLANVHLLRFLPRSQTQTYELQRAGVHTAATAATFILLAVLLAADVVAAKRFLPAEAAGLYASISLAGKVVYFATSALSLLLFPVFTEQRARKVSEARPLLVGAAMIAGASTVLAAAYFAQPDFIVHVLFGAGYRGAAPFLGWIALAFGAYALVYLFATYLLAHRAHTGVALLGAAVATQVLALAFFHGSVGAIVVVQVAVLGVAAVALAVAAGCAGRRMS